MLPLLAVLCPPLAVLATGRPGRATLNVLLTFSLYVPGLLHALAVIARHRTDRRNAALLAAVAAYDARQPSGTHRRPGSGQPSSGVVRIPARVIDSPRDRAA